jgi:hypothetical protein
MNKELEVVLALANSDRDFFDFANEYSLDTSLSAQQQQALAEETLRVLSEDPEYAAQINSLASSATTTRSIGVDVAVVVAITFLLRTHMKIERNEEGKWNFLIEHKPADDSALDALLNRIVSILKP